MKRPKDTEADGECRMAKGEGSATSPSVAVRSVRRSGGRAGDLGRRNPEQRNPEQRDEKADEKATEIAALRLLARREHSTRELRRKLQIKGYAADKVARVVDALSSKKLVCDKRFAASLVGHLSRRGQGPIRIRAELREHGATDEMIEAALGNAEGANVEGTGVERAGADWNWMEAAREVRARKFGSEPPSSLAERAKQARFLQYRGFSADQIRAALSGRAASADDWECSDPAGSE